MKTLINTLYIGLLIVAPVCASFFLMAERYNCPFDPMWLFVLAFLAVLFAPMILALIQNTAQQDRYQPAKHCSAG
jgi:multisubunit Na+/H+ antiporter MnhG subunit